MNTKDRNGLLLLFFIFSIMFSFEGIYLFSQTETIDPALLVASYVVGIIFLESVLLFILSYMVKPVFLFMASVLLASNLFVLRLAKLFFLLIVSIFLVGNLFFLKLLFFSSFQNLSVLTIFILIIILGFILFLLLHLTKHLNKRKTILYILIGLIILVFSPLMTLTVTGSNDVNGSNDVKGVMPSSILEQWKQIKFKEKPNIYLISFDSMIPSEIAKKYMDIQEVLPYTPTIEANMLKKSPSFTPRAPTQVSLNFAMNLEDASISRNNLSFFPGRKPSVLTSIVSSNDYYITTGFSSFYFGKKGASIDKFKTLVNLPLIETILCIDVKTSLIMQTRLFGVCNVVGKYSSINSLLNKKQKEGAKGWVAKVLDTFRENYYKIRPQFSFFYIFSPNGHTPGSYRHANLAQRKSYRNQFLSSATELNKILHRLMDIVKAQDPKSIVMVFGDHGAWFSRGVSSKKFSILDRYTIELAVLKTEHLCASDNMVFHYSPSYATPSRVLAAIFRCLAKEPKEVDKLVNFADIEAFNEIYEGQFSVSTVRQ